MFDGRLFGEQVVSAVKDYVGKAITDLKSQISLLAERIDDLEVREPVNGKDADPSVIAKMVADAVATIPKPKDGENGKDADPAIILRMVSDAVAAIPKPKDGIDGANGADGTSVTIEDVSPLIVREIANAVAKIPAPKDGVGIASAIINRRGELVFMLSDGSTRELGNVVGRDGSDGKDGSPGLNGKDGRDGLNGADGLPGANGKDGEPGLPGARGLDGKNGEPGERGADGQSGTDGKDAPPVTKEQIAAAVTEYIAANPLPKGEPGKPGENGKDINPATIWQMIDEAVSKLPTPKDGINGKDAPPIDLDEIDAAVHAQIDSAVARYLEANPIRNGEDGKSIKGEEGRGIKSALIDANGDLIVVFTDGETQNVGLVKGADGKDADHDSTEKRLSDEFENIKTYIDARSAQEGVAEQIQKAIDEHIALVSSDKYKSDSASIQVPDEIADQVSKAISLLAESPPLKARSTGIVVNVNHIPEQRRKESVTTDIIEQSEL